MIFDDLKQSAIYQGYFRPLLWAPINAHRRYLDAKARRLFERLAQEDTRLLAHVRAQKERFYADERNPLVSITTPTYNRATILVDITLPSVMAQTYTNFEWLIVGDHCTDHTGELLAQIQDPRVQFQNLPTRPRYPRNKQQRWRIVGYKANTLAHQMAKGTWIAHLDDDDIYTTDHIEKLLAHAQAGNYEFVSGRCKIENRPGEWIERRSAPTGNGSAMGQVSHSTVFYRAYLDRCFAYDPGCLKLNMAGDAYRWRRMVNAGVRVGFLNEVVTAQPLRPGEASRSIFQPE